MKRIIVDMRGSSYEGNLLHIEETMHYGGYPVTEIRKSASALFPSNHVYDIICSGLKVGEIALTEKDFHDVSEILLPSVKEAKEIQEREDGEREILYCSRCMAMFREECICESENDI